VSLLSFCRFGDSGLGFSLDGRGTAWETGLWVEFSDIAIGEQKESKIRIASVASSAKTQEGVKG